jgi:sugar-specific transcriptional regulator TrmB
MSEETYDELKEQLAEALREKLIIERQRNAVINALQDVMDAIENCAITEVPHGYGKVMDQAKETLETLQRPRP